MDSSNLISILKNNIIKKIINDDEIVKVIDCKDSENLKWNPTYLNDSYNTRHSNFTPCIYTYNKFPEYIENALTFIIVLVQIPRCFTDLSKVEPRIELWIYSHKDHIYIDDKNISLNRNDYIAELLIKKFNKNDKELPYDFEFNHTEEGAYDKVHLYRKVEFKCKAFNKSKCDVEL